MIPQVKIKDAIGKTIEAVSLYGHQFFLVFADKTFAYLENINGYQDMNVDLFAIGNEAVRLGIAPAEELAAIKAQKDAETNAFRDKIERAEYERLKCKFET